MPCKMIGPALHQLAAEYDGRLKVGKVNVDIEADLAGQFNIISIPTLLLFKDGSIVSQKVGAVPKHELEKMVGKLV